MSAIRIDKLLIARSQLLTAIELHFADKDPISVHTLAGASREIIETLCRVGQVKPFSSHIQRTFPEKSLNDIWQIMNLYRNAFKHANHDDDDVIAQFQEPDNDFLIYVAVADYLALRRASPIPMQVFQVWFEAVHEDRLASHVDMQPYHLAFPDIRAMPRLEQKRLGREMIVRCFANPELLSNPDTEPMILP